ncbi:hypothetical protein ACFC1T_09450 [Kitasatospora sp. NPDC056076]|uniref:hypothetical protein n=1 Tax=Kitasatospora sp. NPDC056076 TaxID=3345703 RepID=UPI0035DAC23C
MTRTRLFHPAKFAGRLLAVRPLSYFQDPTHGDCLRSDIATDDDVHRDLVVRSGGLVNQWYTWIGAGPVVGVLGQTGSGYSTPWTLHPTPERDRPDVEKLLSLDHVRQWLEPQPEEAPF